jgi:hypothetical protein
MCKFNRVIFNQCTLTNVTFNSCLFQNTHITNYSKVTNEEIGNSAIIGINKTIKTKLRENLIDKDFGFISKIEGGLTTIDQTSNSSTELPQTPPNLDELKEYSNSSKLLSFYDWKSYKSPKWQ